MISWTTSTTVAPGAIVKATGPMPTAVDPILEPLSARKFVRMAVGTYALEYAAR